ncbi:MAG: hypothetical protein DRJ47_07210 [Thermoprotei archaeon]|nr:MAG: hypothetical protein DRJ47_07210 [Thermoprotei archaeon]
MVDKVSQTIKVSKLTKVLLARYAARLQEKLGRRVSFDEALRHLLVSCDKKPELLTEVLGSVPGLSSKEVFQERRLDYERRAGKLCL